MHMGLRGMATMPDIAGGETLVSLPVNTSLLVIPKEHCRFNVVEHMHAGLRGMAATRDIADGETLVSLPVSAALVVTPKERCKLPATFCSKEFFSGKPW